MLLTGRQLWHAEKVDNAKALKDGFVDQGKCWSQLMEAAGYETFMTGKWHVKADTKKIFNHVRNERPGMPKTVAKAYNRPLDGRADPWDPTDTSNGGFWAGGKHWSEVQADDALEFLGMATNSSFTRRPGRGASITSRKIHSKWSICSSRERAGNRPKNYSRNCAGSRRKWVMS